MKRFLIILLCSILFISCEFKRDEVLDAVETSLRRTIVLVPSLKIVHIEYGSQSRNLWDADWYVISKMRTISELTDSKEITKEEKRLKDHIESNYVEKKNYMSYKKPISSRPIKVTYEYLNLKGEIQTDIKYFNLIKYKIEDKLSLFNSSTYEYEVTGSADYLFK